MQNKRVEVFILRLADLLSEGKEQAKGKEVQNEEQEGIREIKDTENYQHGRRRIIKRYWQPNNRLFSMEKGPNISEQAITPVKGTYRGNFLLL